MRLNVVVPHGKERGHSNGRYHDWRSRSIQPAEVKDVELYHPKSWVTKYVFCQDAKVIAIQYSITALSIGLVALVLSW
jgi:Heme/copper-type cytochrome/quinol oxidases, subunit 1